MGVIFKDTEVKTYELCKQKVQIEYRPFLIFFQSKHEIVLSTESLGCEVLVMTDRKIDRVFVNDEEYIKVTK